jgi:multidrug efflux pump subunit AcrA (membrane-fusion protein)
VTPVRRRRRPLLVAAAGSLLVVAAVALALRPPGVSVAEVARRDLVPAVHAVGTIEVKSAVSVGARIGGRLAAVLVDQGDVVEPGQVVAQLDDAQLVAEVRRAEEAARAAAAQRSDVEAGSRAEEIAEARGNLARAQASLDDLLAGSRPEEIEEARARLRSAAATRVMTERERRRTEALHTQGLVAAQDADRARQAHEVAEAQERAAEQTLRLAEQGPRRHQVTNARAQVDALRARLALLEAGPRPHQLAAARAQAREADAALALARERAADAVVRSPLGGYVVSRELEPGATVNAGTPIVKVADARTAWATVHVDEHRTGAIAVGDAAVVTLRSQPGAPQAGRVARVRRESDRVTEQLAVDVTLDTPPPRLTLGEQVEAVIHPAPRRGATVVPAGALVRGREGAGVWTVVDGRLAFRAVTLGVADAADWVEALAGLRPGDLVVLAPGRLATADSEGRRVRATHAPAP